MVRRLKEELAQAEDIHRAFAKREVVALSVPEDPVEQKMSDLLTRYVEQRRAGAAGKQGALRGRVRPDRAPEALPLQPVRLCLLAGDAPGACDAARQAADGREGENGHGDGHERGRG